MEEFGLEAKRHLLTNEASEMLARQYAEAFEGKVKVLQTLQLQATCLALLVF